MDEFPDPEDDFEALYEDEIEMMNEMELEYGQQNMFETHASQKVREEPKQKNATQVNTSVSVPNIEPINTTNTESDSLLNAIRKSEEFLKQTNEFQSRVKRVLPFDDRSDNNNMVELNSIPVPKKKRALAPMVDQFGYSCQPPTEDNDLKIIDRIMAYRKKIIEDNLSLSDDINLMKNNVKKMQPVIHRHLPKGGFQSITTVSGCRLYLDVIDPIEYENSIDLVLNEKNNLRLLPESFSSVKAKAEIELEKLVIRKSLETDIEPKIVAVEDTTEAGNLWVERYKPRHYLDLLSDEATNRTVLSWMKLWDKLVFGVDASKNSKNIGKENKKDTKPTFFNKSAPEVIKQLDEHKKPQQKVVLLCGPPGLGKTTLAHIIAKHAGYSIVEMNASDDRNTEAFKRNLENATSMKTVFGDGKLPNCLIIDEIDGAPAASINLLVNMLLENGAKKNEAKKRKKEVSILKRPVICICNDLYTPSLRPLRQIALVIQFPPTYTLRLMQRLHDICINQKLKVDRAVLKSLCEKTENDIRSCLSVLQFIKSTSGVLRGTDLDGIAVGQKDYQRSLFTTWQEIFAIPRLKSKQTSNPHKTEQSTTNIQSSHSNELLNSNINNRFRHILQAIQSCGEYEKLMQGWFENYPNVKFRDQHFTTVVKGLEWCCFSDIIQKEIHHSQVWILLSYLSYSFVGLHFLFAVHQRPKLQFPKQYSEYLNKLSKNRSILNSLANNMSPSTLFFSQTSSLIFDILPILIYILQPTLRSVNVKLFSSKEKEILNNLISTMINYNLTYQQDKQPDGQYVFNIDPNIDEIIYFPNVPRIKPLAYSTRQLIAHEVELEKVRRADKYFKSPLEVPKEINKAEIKKPQPPKPKLESINKRTPVVMKDFFGRVIQPSTNEVNEELPNYSKSDITYKFKQGYTNAVRRPIKVKEFFL